MSVPRGFCFGLVLALSLLAPAHALARQVDPDSVRATATRSTVEGLFGRLSLEGTDSVGPTIPTPTVEALFRSALVVEVASSGSDVDRDGYLVVVRDARDGTIVMQRRVTGSGGVVPSPALEPGDYDVGLEDVEDRCTFSPTRRAPVQRGAIVRVRLDVACRRAGTSITVEVSEGTPGETDATTVQVGETLPRQIEVGTPVTFDGLDPGSTRLVLTLPHGMTVPPFAPPVARSSVTFEVIRSTTMSPDSATVDWPGTTRRTIGIDQAFTIDSLAPGPTRVTLTLPATETAEPDPTTQSDPPPSPGATGPAQNAWHLGAALGAIAVAATGPTTFITPTLSVALVHGEPDRESLYLSGHVGYWKSGPSGTDPVLPSDPRPAFRNRTIWTWSVGAALFPRTWGGMGVSAAWVEGRETSSELDKYMNRTRGVAVGPRLRLLPGLSWPSIILGVDVQYGEADQLRLDEPELRWSLTPVLSFGYVLH